MVLLSGSAIVTYSSSIAAAPSLPSLPSPLPIARLGPMETVGALGALTFAPLPAGVAVSAWTAAAHC